MLIFFLFVFGPLLLLVPSVARETLKNGTDVLSLMLPNDRRLSLLLMSVLYAAGVAFAGTLVGLFSASFIYTRPGGRARFVPLLILAVLPIPPTIHALAWMGVWARITGLLTAHGFYFPSLWGWFGAVWVQTMSLIPFSFGISLIALRNLDPLVIDAARTMRNDLTTLIKIVLPQIRPALITVAVFVFVMTLSDYAVPSIFSVSVYPLEIFSDFSAQNNPARALLLSVPPLIITGAVVLFAQSSMREVATETPRGALGTSFRLDFPSWWKQIAAISLLLAFFSFFVPLFMLMIDVGSVSHIIGAIKSAKGAIRATVLCALISAAVALVPAYCWADGIRRLGRMGTMLWVAAIMMTTVGGSLFGIGLIYLGNLGIFENLTDTMLFPILVSVGRFCPWAAIIIFSFAKRIDPLFFDAAEVYEMGPVHGFMKIRLPLMMPGIIAAGILVSVLAAGELSGTLMVLPPGVDTMIPRIFTYLHYGATPSTAALSLTMGWGFFFLFIVFLRLLTIGGAERETYDDSSR